MIKRNVSHRLQQIGSPTLRPPLDGAVGATDIVIAVYAIAAEQVLVTRDTDFLHIARALKRFRSWAQLHVIHIAESGEVTLV